MALQLHELADRGEKGQNIIKTQDNSSPSHQRKSNRAMETLPSSSGPFLCLLESGEPPAFWLSSPNRDRLSMDSRGSTATAMGKFILQ